MIRTRTAAVCLFLIALAPAAAGTDQHGSNVGEVVCAHGGAPDSGQAEETVFTSTDTDGEAEAFAFGYNPAGVACDVDIEITGFVCHGDAAAVCDVQVTSDNGCSVPTGLRCRMNVEFTWERCLTDLQSAGCGPDTATVAIEITFDLIANGDPVAQGSVLIAPGPDGAGVSLA